MKSYIKWLKNCFNYIYHLQFVCFLVLFIVKWISCCQVHSKMITMFSFANDENLTPYLDKFIYLQNIYLWKFIFRFIEDILSAISNGLHARIEFSKKNKKQQTKMIESHREKISFLTVECKKVGVILHYLRHLLMKLLNIYTECFK